MAWKRSGVQFPLAPRPRSSHLFPVVQAVRRQAVIGRPVLHAGAGWRWRTLPRSSKAHTVGCDSFATDRPLLLLDEVCGHDGQVLPIHWERLDCGLQCVRHQGRQLSRITAETRRAPGYGRPSRSSGLGREQARSRIRGGEPISRSQTSGTHVPQLGTHVPHSVTHAGRAPDKGCLGGPSIGGSTCVTTRPHRAGPAADDSSPCPPSPQPQSSRRVPPPVPKPTPNTSSMPRWPPTPRTTRSTTRRPSAASTASNPSRISSPRSAATRLLGSPAGASTTPQRSPAGRG